MQTLTNVIGITIVNCAIFAHAADVPASGTPAAEPISLPRAQQYDITSKINGLKYRIMVATPGNADPPLVEAHYQVDQARQIIYGKSLVGLLVLHLLFLHPETFQTYIAASPAIWWDNRSVLPDEKTFAQGIKTSNLRLKVLITTAGNEQYRGPDPKLQAEDIYRMIDNASELAGRDRRLRSPLVGDSFGVGVSPKRDLQLQRFAPCEMHLIDIRGGLSLRRQVRLYGFVHHRDESNDIA